MIVIKGRSEKSKHLEHLIRVDLKTNNALILDAAKGNRAWSGGDWATVRTLEGFSSYEQVIEIFENNYNVWGKFDWIVFYINSDAESIKRFKELENKYSQNFIVTIQDNGITDRHFV